MCTTLDIAVAPADAAVLRAATRVADIALERATARDSFGSVIDTEIAALASTGLLHAPLSRDAGGRGMGLDAASAALLRNVLRIIGGASLSLGRLYEGHVNAARLVHRYGSDHQMALLAREAEAGRLSAVWNAQERDGLKLVDAVLTGGKIYTSGIGIVHRPILTAMRDDGLVMVIADVADARGDLSAWTPLGMRGSMTGRGDFTGIAVADAEVVGAPGDYYRAPLFAGGAWRVLAVQLGGLERLVALYRAHIDANGRRHDPVQRARFGETVARLETARLWSLRTAMIAEDPAQDAAEIDALVNLGRHEFENAAVAIIQRVERGIGLSAMLYPNPIERIIRDLTTYLRQPFPDAALDAAALWACAERPLHTDMGTRA